MSEQDIAYGGQAVIGGVMIQSPKGWSLGCLLYTSPSPRD